MREELREKNKQRAGEIDRGRLFGAVQKGLMPKVIGVSKEKERNVNDTSVKERSRET